MPNLMKFELFASDESSATNAHSSRPYIIFLAPFSTLCLGSSLIFA